jgi:2-dehydropantoate 2-reductase
VKIAVVGAGAIGGYVGGWLAAAGEDVTFIARGANLDAIRKSGMRVIGEDGLEVMPGTVAAMYLAWQKFGSKKLASSR